MKNTGNLYRETSFRDCGRKAGDGIVEDDYGDESFPPKRNYYEWEPVRMPSDNVNPEDLNGPVIVIQAGKDVKHD